MIKVRIEDGYYLFKLKNLLEIRKISINKLMKDTNTDFKTIKRLMSGELLKLDIIVLARLCDYLKCNIVDIVEYKHI